MKKHGLPEIHSHLVEVTSTVCAETAMFEWMKKNPVDHYVVLYNTEYQKNHKHFTKVPKKQLVTCMGLTKTIGKAIIGKFNERNKK